MKPTGGPFGDTAKDTLSVYLDLENRVKDLENEVSFIKLLMNTVYAKVQEHAPARESIDTPEEENSIAAYLKTSLSPRLDKLIEEHERLLRDLGGPGKAD